MAENVEEIGTGQQQNNGGGRVFVVDPNPPNNEVVPSEDMFIYVKLSAYPKSRTTYNGNGTSLLGVEDEVNFISTKIKYNGEGKLEPKPQDTYATTDWTGIGGFKNSDTVSGGILEGFGIKSISIKYNASLVPQVDVTFTDVRGGGLFDVITNNDILSPFALFFKMPYPTFKLSVKGYFGETVEYCLHMINWTSNFDGKTGNFDISANFLGFQQAFLNDMVLGNIIGVVNTTEGTNKLNDIFNASTNTEVKNATQGIRKLDDFFVQIANLNLDSERLKLNSDNFRLLKFLNGKVNLLEEIQGIVGSPITKEENNQGNKDYLKIKNDPNLIVTDGITDSVLFNQNNYLSIRDFLLINIVNLSEYKSYVTTLNDSVRTYNEYINSVDTDDAKDSLENLKNQSNDKTKNTNKESITKVLNYLEVKPEDNKFINLFNIGNDTDDWKEYLLSSQKNDITNNNFTLKNVFEEMYTEKSSLGIYLKENYPKDDSGVNSDFDINNFFTVVTTGNGLYTKTLSESTKVLVVDFREIRAVLAKQINDLKDVIKSQKEIVQREINDELFSNFQKNNNFLPNIQNCFEIIANNTQAMVETIYGITQKSEESSISANRNSILKGYDTDIPPSLLKEQNGKGVAWPTIYRTNDADGSKNEIYIGELNRVNRQNFPEYDFVERVYDNFVKRKERLVQVTKSSVAGLDSDNWFPINPIDYRENPFLVFRGYNDNDSVKESFIETTFERVGVLLNYSNFDNDTGYQNLSNYGKFDALNAFDVLKSNNVKQLMLKKILEDLTTSDFLSNEYITNSSYYKENIEVTTPGTLVTFKNNFKFGDVTVGEDYVSFDNTDIVNNSKKLIDSVESASEYTTLTKNKDGNDVYKSELKGNLFYQNSYEDNNNLTTNNVLNVWDIAVCQNLYKSNGNTLDLSNSNLSDINPTGSTGDVGIYLNKTQFKTNGNTLFEELLVGETFYEQQPKLSKGLLLLSTFPFRDFTEGFLNSVFPNGVFNGARVVNLPKLYVAFIGGLLWRENQSADPIVWDEYETFKTPKNEYLTKMSYYGYSSSTDKVIEPNLINLPKSVKDQFIQKFKDWVNQNIGTNSQQRTFERNILIYTKDTESVEKKKEAKEFILEQIKETTNFILFNPKIFTSFNRPLLINQRQYKEYIDTFKSTFNSLVKDDKTGNNDSEKEKKPKNDNPELKLEIYNYFKNINNKWVAGTDDGKGFSVCGDSQSSGKNLIDYFKFIDRGWRDIGKDVTINLKSFLNVGNDYNTSIYIFMSKILKDNNFLFQILPTYINYKDATEISNMFKPQTTIDNNKSNGPLFCGIYVGGVSEYLDIKERNNYHFNNDGWSFKNGEIPSDILDDKKANASDSGKNNEDYSLVAFRVAFGAQNQTIFTDVSLNQQESKETAEYFSVLGDTIDKRGATQPSYIGTNLLRMFKTRSYTCSVNALGCMNIQPLMYFDLQNVPFFNGAYLITSVDHQITPNHMVTSFKGIRQSKYQTKPTTDIVTNVDIDLDEVDSSAPVIFTNIDNTDGLYTIGLRTEIAGEPFDFDQITQGNLELIGVPTSVIVGLGDLQTNLANPIKNKGLTSNSEVTMFLANVLANSNYLQNSSLNRSVGDYQTNEVKFDSDSPFSGETKKYQNSTIEVVNGGDNKYFSYTPTISGETSTGYTKEYAYSFTGEDEKLKEWDKVEFSGDQLTTPLTNLTYYNIYKGDAFMYRPTGYLYMTGRKQYYDFYSDSGIQTPYEYYKDNSKSLEIALKVWTEIKDPDSSIDTSGKTSSEYSITEKDKNGKQMLGSYSIFERTRVVSQQYNPEKQEVSARIFKRILETFYDKSDAKPLIDYTNP